MYNWIIYSQFLINISPFQLAAVGGIPSGVCDVWEATGSRKECLYTWDMMRNTNLVFDKFKPRCRFDRLYLKHSTPNTIKPVYFELIGLEKISSCGKFPSDHWGLLSHYDIIKTWKFIFCSYYCFKIHKNINSSELVCWKPRGYFCVLINYFQNIYICLNLSSHTPP